MTTQITTASFANPASYPAARLVRSVLPCTFDGCEHDGYHVAMLIGSGSAAPVCLSHLGDIQRSQDDSTKEVVPA